MTDARADPPVAATDSDLPLDSHLHSRLSPDSEVAIDAYAALAVERRIAEIAITDHVDFDPREPAYRYTTFEERERLVREAAERWGPQGVAIRFGVEITYARTWEAAIREHLAGHAYDFVIGSVHVGVESPYTKERVAGWVAGRSLAEIVAPYFGEVAAAARSGLFDTVGHVDFVKRYLHAHVQADELEAAPELYDPILDALVESGTSLEINTSGLRQAPGTTYPSAAIVARFHARGGHSVTTGSDAHLEESFAYGLGAGYRVAAEAGFGELRFRRGAGHVPVALPVRFLR